MEQFKAGFVNIYGNPNAGKSTLFNKLLKEKLSIVSPKAQTTRKSFKGIVTTPTYQIVFVDTPGFITNPFYELHRRMIKEIEDTKKGTDAAILLLDIKEPIPNVEKIMKQFAFPQPLFIVLNKIDTMMKADCEEKIKALQQTLQTEKIFSISATEGKNIPQLLEAIVAVLPAHEPYFDGDELTDKSMRFIVAEMIREGIFYLYENEVPYETSILIQQYEQKSSLLKIRADVIVQREQQKKILIGTNGAKVKELGTIARKQIEQLVEQKVFLELYVKVREHWRDNPIFLKEYGY